ncbi:hypothetical protein C8Q72DRAFT_819339 [Fomitopsis betulina]|nr:hypothetical protein C8Q72DRAFT_819339 [Fomitopsis betulina]
MTYRKFCGPSKRTSAASRSPCLSASTRSRCSSDSKAREAARAFLARPVESADVPELVEITRKDLHNLLKYHRACSVVAARVASDPSWVPQSEVWFGTCRARGTCARKHLGNVNASEWWINYMTGSARILEATPAGKALLVEGRTDAALSDAAECMVCKHPAPEQMRRFIRQFAGLVDAVMRWLSWFARCPWIGLNEVRPAFSSR